MKLWFFLLLTFNLALFGYMQFGQPDAGNTNVVQEVNPEKLPLLSNKSAAVAIVSSGKESAAKPTAANETATKDAATKDTATKEAAATAASNAPPPPPANVSAPAPATTQCVQWNNIRADDAPRARAALIALQLGDKLKESQAEEITNGYWVFIPPLATKAVTTSTAATLRKQGVKDLLVLNDNSISLGVFGTEEAATRHLEQLEIKGVRAARTGPRPGAAKDVSFAVRDATASLTAKLNELQKDFTGSSLKQGACS